jgi:hypothetical protein
MKEAAKLGGLGFRGYLPTFPGRRLPSRSESYARFKEGPLDMLPVVKGSKADLACTPGSGVATTMGSIALTLVLLKAQSLRSHALHLFIDFVNFLIEPRIPRFRRIAAAQLFKRFLDGEFGGFSHGDLKFAVLVENGPKETPVAMPT